MIRTYIDLDNAATTKLDSFARDFHFTRSALIGFVIEKWLTVQDNSKNKPAFGLQKGKIDDVLEYQRNIRNEWSSEARSI